MRTSKRNCGPRCLWAMAIIMVAALGSAQASDEPLEPLSIDRIFHGDEFEINQPVSSKWLDDGASYTTVEESKSTYGGFDIVKHDSATGESTILVDAKQLIPEGKDTPLEVKNYSWSDDGAFALISTNTVMAMPIVALTSVVGTTFWWLMPAWDATQGSQ